MDGSNLIYPNDRLRQERIQRNWRQQDVADQVGTTVVTVTRWERGNQQPSAYFRVKLCALFGKSAEELGFVTENQQQEVPAEVQAPVLLETVPFSRLPDTPRLWAIPYARNPFFTGREELLHTLHEQLNRERTMALTQSWAISGLGGIGKTQIALEYAFQYRHDYHSVFWLSAASRETLLAGFITIAELLQLPEKDVHDSNKTIQAVKKWLASHQEWLLILDNADDLTLVHDVLPTELSGHLLLTTRAQALGSLAQRIEVETMGMVEGTLFLLRRAKQLAPDGFLDQVSNAHLAAAEAIVIEMDFLPLALDQAGAYIEEVGCSLEGYLELYRTHRKEFLQRQSHMPNYHPEPVATTWSLSFEKIEQANPTAAELLRLCAFLDPDTIPEELISKGGADLGSVLQQVENDEFVLNKAIEELRKFSLVQRDAENRLLRIHRLVQAVIVDTMEQDIQHQWAERVVRAVNKVFPDDTDDVALSPLCLRYLSQVQACHVLLERYLLQLIEAAYLLNRTVVYLWRSGLYSIAEPLVQYALKISQHVLGAEHSETAICFHNLGRLNHAQGKYEQAEPWYLRTLAIREQQLGPEHLGTAEILNDLSNLYVCQGKHEQAEAMGLRVLAIREQQLGSEHLGTAEIFNDLAFIYHRLGKYEQAQALYQKALAICEQQLGEHPNTAHVLNNLGLLYTYQGKYEQAQPLSQRALAIWEQHLGPMHPSTAYALNNLALLYGEQGKYEQAEPLYQRSLAIWEQQVGPMHPMVPQCLNNLALLYTYQGKYEQAAALNQRALAIREELFGPEHTMVAQSLNNLASVYRDQGKYEQAEPLYQRALAIREQQVGPEHPDTASVLNELALHYWKQGKYKQAESLYQRALVIREQVMGDEHPRTRDTREHLHAVLQAMGETEEIEMDQQ